MEGAGGAAIACKARGLLRRSDLGVLSTWSLALPGHPMGSLAPFALTREGRPVFFVSRLAEHTRNVAGDPRACLTVLEPGGADRQAVARASVLGEVRPVPATDEPVAAARFFALLPQQEAYRSFGDFSFRWLEPARVRWIGGFGEIHWIEREDWLLEAPAWAAGEGSIVRHMNEDHRDALEAMARSFCGAEPAGVEMLAVDPEGFHLRAAGEVRWIAFSGECRSAEDVRAEMVRLAREARKGGRE
jgi:hypothetical protein